MIDSIIDISHHQSVNLVAARADGIIAVIHKATEGATVRDAEYTARRDKARKLGLLWGAYHYSSGASIADQVENFLEYAGLDDSEVMALDWEGSSDGPDMTLAQARRFVQMIRGETGRWPMLYGGRLLRESVGSVRDDILANCPLWYSRYRAAPVGIPTNTWPTYTLWQCTDGNLGPGPYMVKGIGRCDRERFQGTVTELRQQWPFGKREDNVAAGPGLLAIMHTRRMQAAAPAVVNARAKRMRQRVRGG